jgi:hypothetical protein
LEFKKFSFGKFRREYQLPDEGSFLKNKDWLWDLAFVTAKIQDFTKFRKQVSLLKQSFDEIFADFQEDVMCSFSQILF